MLGRTMHSIVYDDLHDEFVVPQQFGQAILTFRGGADGEEAPVRVIQGSLTQLRAVLADLRRHANGVRLGSPSR